MRGKHDDNMTKNSFDVNKFNTSHELRTSDIELSGSDLGPKAANWCV